MERLGSPTRRNAVWSTCQFLLRLFFTLWLGYRARGMEKLPKVGGALLLANHQSFLDPLLVGLPLNRPVSYLARKSLFRIPLFGRFLRQTYVMPVHRTAVSPGSIKEAVGRIEHGFLVGVFPEGTRSRDGRLGDLKPGFLTLIRRGRMPVFPVGIAGAYEAMPRGSWFIRPRRVRVVFGEPFPAEEMARFCRRGEEEAALSLVRQRIEQCRDEAERWRSGQRKARQETGSRKPQRS